MTRAEGSSKFNVTMVGEFGRSSRCFGFISPLGFYSIARGYFQGLNSKALWQHPDPPAGRLELQSGDTNVVDNSPQGTRGSASLRLPPS